MKDGSHQIDSLEVADKHWDVVMSFQWLWETNCFLHWQAYLFRDYWEEIGTIKSFFDANLALTAQVFLLAFSTQSKHLVWIGLLLFGTLKIDAFGVWFWQPPKFSFYDAAKPTFTSPRYLPPTKIERCRVSTGHSPDFCTHAEMELQKGNMESSSKYSLCLQNLELEQWESIRLILYPYDLCRSKTLLSPMVVFWENAVSSIQLLEFDLDLRVEFSWRYEGKQQSCHHWHDLHPICAVLQFDCIQKYKDLRVCDMFLLTLRG
jgi:hypothetical protein